VVSYIIRRVLGMIPMLFAISVFVFLMMHLAPGNAIESMMNPGIKDLAALKAELIKTNNLDKPLYWQYFHWLGLFVTGNFGYSFAAHQPVISLLGPAIRNTLILAVMAEVMLLLLGIPLGILQAKNPYGKFDYTMSIVGFIFYSVPYYIFALFLIYFFAIKLRIFPAQGSTGTGADAGSFIDHIVHAFLPAISIALASFTVYSRYTRGSLLDVGRKDFTRTAYAKGLNSNKVFFKHVFRNGMIPIVTQFGYDIGGLIGGAIILEGLFQYQGMGLLTITAVSNRDYNVIMVTTILIAIGVLIGNLIADILYAVVDPRVRYN